MKCAACGTELERDAKFCHICGQPAPAQAPEESSFCPRCGARLPKLCVFCPRCGVALSDVSPRREPIPAAAAPAPAARAAAPVRQAEPSPAPKKKAKKRQRAPIGGILLALLILALIFGCLGAVLYVEATMRGQTMKEYVVAFVHGEPEAGEARWSDLDKPGASAAPASEQIDSAQDGILTKDVCAIYLDLLQSRQAEIERYDWQQTGTDMPTRQVVLCDVWGDILPELIWVEATDDENVRAATLNIAGIRDGSAVILSSQSWDVQAGGGFHYYLFQEQDSKTLYAFSACGEETWTQRYSSYAERDGGLAADELLTFVTAWDPETGGETRSYAKEGGEISGEEWLAAVGSLQAGTRGVLMYSSQAGDFVSDYVSRNGCPAMTCAGAILLLTECLEAVS